MFDYLKHSILNRGMINNHWSYNLIDIREKSRSLSMYSVDDRPYGGGSGMIISPIIFNDCDLSGYTHKFYMSPRGKVWNQLDAKKIVENSNANILILCGRYEGIDQRVLDYYGFQEISIGDYILCGGELPAMTVIESIVRLIPGVINTDSVQNESFNMGGLLEHDLYTKPQIWNNISVPSVLLSGNHKMIQQWKLVNGLQNTYNKRHDLYVLFIYQIYIYIIIYRYIAYNIV